MRWKAEKGAWWWQWKFFFCLLALQSSSSGTSTTIKSSFEINQKRFPCMGEIVAVTCTINDTAPSVHMSVNGRPFLFSDELMVFTGDGVSAALLSNTNGIRVLSVIITNITQTQYNLTCNSQQYTILVSDSPDQPKLQGYMMTRTRDYATLNLSWTTSSLAKYDLEHYRITVNDSLVALVKNTSVLVNISVPMSDEIQVPVSVSTVTKCGLESGIEYEMVTVEAYNQSSVGMQVGDSNCIVTVVVLAVISGIFILLTIAISIVFFYYHSTKKRKYDCASIEDRDSPKRQALPQNPI